MEITYDTGAKVIFQGPVAYVGRVEWRLSGGREVDRKVGEEPGKQWIEVSNPQLPIPNPFVVRTPSATVTDLDGFGVYVNKEGASEVPVLLGKVVAAPDQRPRYSREAFRFCQPRTGLTSDLGTKRQLG